MTKNQRTNQNKKERTSRGAKMINYMILNTKGSIEQQEIINDIIYTLEACNVPLIQIIKATEHTHYFIVNGDIHLHSEAGQQLSKVMQPRKGADIQRVEYYHDDFKPDFIQEFENKMIENSIMN